MLNKSIRKISVGSDVNNQLHISVGSTMGGTIVDTIIEISPTHYEIWMGRDQGLLLWKAVIGMPVIVEYNTRLD